MKPIRLMIDGINSFKQKEILDFSALNSSLFCIYGDTGAGKSTVLDSVILALYGECNRGDSVRGLDYINLERDSAEVELEFVMEGAVYRIWRQFARGANGEPKKKAALYKDGDLIASQLSEVSRMVVDAIGLSMSDFTQVVVLEQGQFNRFLFSTRKERSITVSKLFHLDRFRDLYIKTDRRLSAVAEKITAIESALNTYSDYTTELKTSLKAELKQAEKSAEEMDKQLENASELCKRLAAERQIFDASVKAAARKKELETDIKTEQTQLSQLSSQIDKGKDEYEKAKQTREETALRLDRIKNLLPRMAEKAEIEAKITAARDKYSATKKAHDDLAAFIARTAAERAECEKQAEQLKSQILALTDFTDFASAPVRAEAVLRDFERGMTDISALQKELDNATAEEKIHRQALLRFSSDLENLKTALAEIEKQTAKAEDEYQAEMTVSSAAFIASTLHSGDPCPVCGGSFNGFSGEKGDASGKKSTLDELRKKLKQTETRSSEADSLVKLRQQKIMDLESKKLDLSARLKRLTDGQNEFKVKSIDDCKRLIALSKTAFTQFDTAAKMATELEKSAVTLATYAASMDEQRQTGIEIRARLDSITNEIKQKGGDDPAEQERLNQGLKITTDFITNYEQNQKEIAGKISAFTSSIAAKSKELSLIEVKQINFDEAQFVAAEAHYKSLLSDKSKLAEGTGILKQRLEIAATALRRKSELDSELKTHKKLADRLSTLKKLFKGEKFLEFIADEYISAFTVDASVVLGEISGGKYSLDYEQGEGKFYVTDFLSGGKKRKVSTLSGGEIFLASLALATAIARHISSKSYDFFFLDEGFGTLDIKKMDMVADALAQLSRHSMVGIISHRAELVERMPSRIRIAPAGGDDGSRIFIE